MIQTNKLRFVERTESRQGPDGGSYWAIIRVLQQWWQSVHHPDEGEWRDVPLEEEA